MIKQGGGRNFVQVFFVPHLAEVFLHFGVDRLSRDVRPQVRVVVGPGGRRLVANAANERFLAGVSLQVIGQVVVPGEPLVAEVAAVVPAAGMFRHVALPVGLVGELEAALVANERLHA